MSPVTCLTKHTVFIYVVNKTHHMDKELLTKFVALLKYGVYFDGEMEEDIGPVPLPLPDPEQGEYIHYGCDKCGDDIVQSKWLRHEAQDFDICIPCGHDLLNDLMIYEMSTNKDSNKLA